MKRTSKLPTLPRAGKETMKVWKMIFKLFWLLNNLNMRPILNVLITDVDGPKEILLKVLMPIPTNVPITIMRSKVFQLSLKN